MKQFVKALHFHRDCFKYNCYTFPGLSREKAKSWDIQWTSNQTVDEGFKFSGRNNFQRNSNLKSSD